MKWKWKKEISFFIISPLGPGCCCCCFAFTGFFIHLSENCRLILFVHHRSHLILSLSHMLWMNVIRKFFRKIFFLILLDYSEQTTTTTKSTKMDWWQIHLGSNLFLFLFYFHSILFLVYFLSFVCLFICCSMTLDNGMKWKLLHSILSPILHPFGTKTMDQKRRKKIYRYRRKSSFRPLLFIRHLMQNKVK